MGAQVDVKTDTGWTAPFPLWMGVLAGPVAFALLTQLVAEPMKRQGGGAIVNVSSISAWIAQPNRWTYNLVVVRASPIAVALWLAACGGMPQGQVAADAGAPASDPQARRRACAPASAAT